MVEPLLSLVASFIWVSPRVTADCEERTSGVDVPLPLLLSLIAVPVRPAEVLFSSLATADLLSPRAVLPEVPTDPLCP
jgi:hypothetical protein